MERRNNQMNLSAKPYVPTHQQNQGIEVIYESKRGGGYRRGGKRKNARIVDGPRARKVRGEAPRFPDAQRKGGIR